MPEVANLTAKDFETDQDVRWCPGCGDYSILKQVQTVMPQTGVRKEDIVFISGIGCAARFPYYMETFGMHSIHGRALAIASGLKSSNVNLSVWVISGDGDCLSIGGNHLIHTLRRNINMNLLLFNNEIYGLTKGQYSPTSEEGKMTKSSPMGSLDHPFNPLAVAMGADGTFIARTMDRDPKHLQAMLLRSDKHRGTSLLEIYQNCVIFNDGAFFVYTDKGTKKIESLFLEHGQPLVFGENNEMGIVIDGMRPKIVNLEAEGISKDDCWIHDENDLYKAQTLIRFFDDPSHADHLPRPFGVFYENNRDVYEDKLMAQLEAAKEKMGPGDLDALLKGGETWEIA